MTVELYFSTFIMAHSPNHLRFRAASFDPDDAQSFTSSHEEENWKKSEDCSICHTRFSHLKVKRHHCRFCGHSVCDNHSLGRRMHVETGNSERICDKCDAQRIGGEYRATLRKEIDEKRGLCEQLKAQMKGKRNDCEKILHDIEEAKLTQHNNQMRFDERELILERKIATESSTFSASESVEKALEESLDRAKELVIEANISLESRELQRSSLQSALDSLHCDLSALEHRVDLVHAQAKDCISRLKLPDILCPNCLRALQSRSLLSDQETTIMTQRLTHSLDLPPPHSSKSCTAECSVM